MYYVYVVHGYRGTTSKPKTYTPPPHTFTFTHANSTHRTHGRHPPHRMSIVVSGNESPRCPSAVGLGRRGTVVSALPQIPRRGAGNTVGGMRKPAWGEPTTSIGLTLIHQRHERHSHSGYHSPRECKRLLIAQQWRRLFQKPHQAAASHAPITFFHGLVLNTNARLEERSSHAGADRYLVAVAALAAVRLPTCASSLSSSDSSCKRRCWQRCGGRTVVLGATMRGKRAWPRRCPWTRRWSRQSSRHVSTAFTAARADSGLWSVERRCERRCCQRSPSSSHGTEASQRLECRLTRRRRLAAATRWTGARREGNAGTAASWVGCRFPGKPSEVAGQLFTDGL